jgi:peptide/nickel transport system permease protein
MGSQSSPLDIQLPVRDTAAAGGHRRGPLDAFGRLARNATGMIGLVIIVVFSCFAVAAPLIAPYPPNDQDYRRLREGPSRAHIFGTDELGRDLFSRIVYGARISIGIGIGASVGGVLLAGLFGITTALFRGWYDLAVQRLVDIVIGFPAIVLILSAMVAFGGSTASRRVLVLVVVLWVLLAAGAVRIVRSSALTVVNQPFIEAERVLGASNLRIMAAHLLPNVLPVIIVLGSIQVAAGILAESSLAFLGYGVPAPAPAWGSMLGVQGLANMYVNPWMVVFPGLAITLVVYAFNMFGDALRDLLDPKLRTGR